MVRKLFFYLSSALIVGLLLNTGIGKFIDFNNSVVDMNGQPFPDSWSKTLVAILGGLEIGIALLFFSERTHLPGLYGAMILLSMFTVYAGLVLIHVFARVPCSCGGFMRGLTWPQHLLVTGTAVAVCIWCIRAYPACRDSDIKLLKS